MRTLRMQSPPSTSHLPGNRSGRDPGGTILLPAPVAATVILLAAALSSVGALPASAQVPPSTDIFLLSLTGEGGALELGEVENLTDREGYDNQPAFSPDGELLYYTSSRDGQTDIWVHELGTGDSRVLRSTPESEYSPTSIPGEDALSVVRVEEDGKQRLWRLPLDGGAPSLVLEDVEPVGYHAWWGEELLLFVLGEPHELVRVDGSDPESKGRRVALDIGRALHRIPGQDAFSFVHKEGDRPWQLKRLDVHSDQLSTLLPMRGEREDLTWSPDGRAWMADGNVLYRYTPSSEVGWQEVGRIAGVGEITRLAFHPGGDRLAFVASRSTEQAEAGPEDAGSEGSGSEGSGSEEG